MKIKYLIQYLDRHLGSICFPVIVGFDRHIIGLPTAETGLNMADLLHPHVLQSLGG